MISAKVFSAIGILLLCASQNHLMEAQRLPVDELPALRDRAMVLHITTKIEENNQELWNAFDSRVTMPGRPVVIRLVGENLNIIIQFTPYLQDNKYTLVAQSQIWINIPERGMSYRTANHSIPIDFGESILYFPLGADRSPDTPLIELNLTMYRFGEEPRSDDNNRPGREHRNRGNTH